MTNNHLRFGIISLLFATPFISLIVASSLFFPYITGKNLMFRLLVEVAGIMYLMLALREPAFRPKINSVVVAFAAFLAVIGVANIFGEDLFKSFWSNFERMEGYVTLIHLFAYFIMLTAVLNTERLWKRFFQTSLVVSVIMGAYGLVQLSESEVPIRISAQLGNSTYLGVYALFHIFIAGFFLIRHIERPRSDKGMQWFVAIMYGALIAFNFYILFKTGTRGALLGLLGGAIFTSIAFAIFEKHKVLKYSGIGLLTAIIIAVSLLAGFKESSYVQDNSLLARFAQLATFDPEGLEQFATTQGKGRFGIWNIAIEGFQERPILGWGQDNFHYPFAKYYDPNLYDQEQWFDRAHNVFLDWLIAGGILGLLAYLGLFGAAIAAIWRSRKHEGNLFLIFSDKVILTALLIAYFIHNLFVFDSITSYMLFFAVLAFINIHERKSFNNDAFFRPIKDQKKITAASIIVLIAGGVAIYYFVLLPYLSGRELIKALTYRNLAASQNSEEMYALAYQSFDKAISYNTAGREQAREQLLQGTSGVLSSDASLEIKNAFFSLNDREANKQLAETPNDVRPHLFYGSFYTRINAGSSTELFDQGFSYLEKARELSPQKQSVMFEKGSALINVGRYDEAVLLFKEAFELAEAYDEARLYYGAALIYAGNYKEAASILSPLSGTSRFGDVRILRAYYERGQIEEIKELLAYKVSLAEQLAEQDQIEAAIREIREVISISPNYAEQGQAFISELQKRQ